MQDMVKDFHSTFLQLAPLVGKPSQGLASTFSGVYAFMYALADSFEKGCKR